MDPPIGGPAYIKANPYVAYFYLTYTASLAVVGCVGNICVLSSFVVNRNLRAAQNVFLVSLALADLVVTSVGDPMAIVGMVMGKTYFEARPVGCDVIATICLCACVTALFSIGGISFNRYLHVCHSAYYPRIFTLRNNILMCIGFWVIGFVMTLPALVGWTDNKYDHKLMECHWSRTHSLSYTIFFSTCVIFTPVSIILISYIKIFLFFRASKQRVAASKGLQKQGSSKKDDAAIKLARSLFIIFSIFAVCWTPYAILALVDYKYNFRHEVMLFTVAFGHMHSTLNPIVYGLTNRHFRAAYARILTKVCNIRVKVEPETSIGATSMSEGTQHVNNSVNRETNTTSNM